MFKNNKAQITKSTAWRNEKETVKYGPVMVTDGVFKTNEMNYRYSSLPNFTNFKK